MATQSPAQQGGSQTPAQQPSQQQGSQSPQQGSQQGQTPVFRDWASI